MVTQPPPQKRGQSPQFSAHVYCDQTAAWIKMPLGTKSRPRPRQDCVRWGSSFPSPKRGGAPSLISGPCLLWLNGWTDQDGTCHRGGPWSRPHCGRWGPSCLFQKRGQSPPIFGPCLLWPNGWMDEDDTWYGSRAHCVRRGLSSPPRKGHNSPPLLAHVYCGHGRPSQLLLSSCTTEGSKNIRVLLAFHCNYVPILHRF